MKKLVGLALLPMCLSAEASVIHVDVDGVMTGGFSEGEPIHLSIDFDLSKRTRSQFNGGFGYYEWATSEPNWIDISFKVGAASFDASVSTDTVEGLALTDRELGAERDSWNESYIGRQLTPISPFIDGRADALLGFFNINTFIFNGGDFIHGLGKEQEFNLTGDLGTGSLAFGYQLVRQYDGDDQYDRESAITLSPFTRGTFNITSAVAKKVPEPGPLALLCTSLLLLTRWRRRATPENLSR